jgi:hypothetical protein
MHSIVKRFILALAFWMCSETPIQHGFQKFLFVFRAFGFFSMHLIALVKFVSTQDFLEDIVRSLGL